MTKCYFIPSIALAGVIGPIGACADSPSDDPVSHPARSRQGAEERLRAKAVRGGAPWPLESPRIVIEKGDRRLELFASGRLVATYPVALGNEAHLDKEREGDHRTPEGEFFVCTRNARSRFHLCLGLSYPSREDAERGLQSRLISRREYRLIVSAAAERRRPPWNTGLGGEVGIHGGGTGSDWTWGCVALENDAIEELWLACPLGTPVQIRK
jgi:hypothetical protein